jgi:hypothetical protein
MKEELGFVIQKIKLLKTVFEISAQEGDGDLN